MKERLAVSGPQDGVRRINYVSVGSLVIYQTLICHGIFVSRDQKLREKKVKIYETGILMFSAVF